MDRRHEEADAPKAKPKSRRATAELMRKARQMLDADEEEADELMDDDHLESVFDLGDDDADDEEVRPGRGKAAGREADNAWGTKRSSFYENDEGASDDEEQRAPACFCFLFFLSLTRNRAP